MQGGTSLLHHIIFNSIDVDEGKVYHSYYGSYMNIRNQSDKLCKEHNLSVIDQETQKEINEIKRRKFVNWYDWNEDKKCSSYKSKLQFDIDRTIKQSINWQDFLSKMESHGYEIKFGKHIAFRGKNQQRFTRAKTIGEDYTEERLKERITENQSIKVPPVKKRIGNVINMNTNAKVKDSKGYEYWATKHNLNTMAESVIFIREHGINSVKQLDEYIRKSAEERQALQDKIKEIDKDIQLLSDIMEQIHAVKKYRSYYKEYKSNHSDKAFFAEYKAEITRYETALATLKKSYSKLPNSKDILDKLDTLQEKKNTLMQEYSSAKSTMDELYQIRKNYGIYMDKEMER
ncbi:TPA: relaxase/mobilization nuclease domain-containing protein [Streptococcus equi subsp. zooepidemicus]|nr:relaxase/mobilization nuclease domain-containing protein [Streptococcus equi subsp. zooepidemicus]MCD3427457.1 relaxase/mobilization nuclease domain-containing protein [Streptococcus equi subsp. zooepidemicus]HEL0592129.1 relaxase/mobilization nuclease domain-containing protein [Streptococcus equi subsp. zooepidemicus]HEL1221405.1 relaxase/mobilization nuclease domain-containing protein [Streptococcus equi subsp. zooepidemicus]HEL1228774.1 relaxase/mobilization nuclease domain-containing pro